MKSLLRKYVPQVLLIVFSVVLGLYLSELLRARKDRKVADKLVSHLKKEIRHCRNEMITWLPYHKRALRQLDSVIVDEKFMERFHGDSESIFELFPRGILNANFTTSAWETAVLNPAFTEVDYHMMTDMAEVYKQMEITFEPIHEIMKIILSQDFNSKSESHGNLKTISRHLHEMAGREISLLTLCNEAIGDTIVSQQRLVDSLILHDPNKI